MQHVLTQAEYDRFISGNPYVDPALDNIGNSHFTDLQKNTISGFLYEARRYGEITTSIGFERPDDCPVAPPLPASREESMAYTEGLKQANKEIIGAALQRLADAGLAVDPEKIREFSFIPFAGLTLTEAQLVAISNDPTVTSITESRQGAVGQTGSTSIAGSG